MRNHPVSDISVVAVERLNLAYVERAWPFAEARRADIAAHFAALRRKKPALWNGEVLMLGNFSIADKAFSGSFFAVDYASFLAWHDWGHPDHDVHNCFAAGAIRASDGGFLLGVMAPGTANAGVVYFPCGTPDPSDIVAGEVDLAHNIRRELAEETGLDIAELDAQPGWTTVLAGPWIAHMQLLQARQPADALRRRMLDHLARQSHPELADIRIVRGPADLDSMMPPFAVGYLRHIWRSDRL